VLMTLDLDFANVQAYPPKSHPGIVVFRSKSQDKSTQAHHPNSALFMRVLFTSGEMI